MQNLNNTVETVVTAAEQRVYVRNMLRAEFKRCVEAGHLLADGSGSTPLRKHLLSYVVQLGGAKNSGPAEYNVVLLELIAANVVHKVARGVLVAVAPAVLEVNSELPAANATETVSAEATVTGPWLICNKATGAVEGSADSKNKAYAAKTAEQVVRKAATV